MQNPQRPAVSMLPLMIVVGLLIFVALVVAALFFIGVAAGRAGAREVEVPLRSGSDETASTDLPDGWQSYHFRDLGLSADLPCRVTPKARSMPAPEAWLVTDAVTYSGTGPGVGVKIGAFWEKFPTTDPVKLAEYNMARPEAKAYRYGDPKYVRMNVDGAPACAFDVTSIQGQEALSKSLYMVHDHTVIYLEVWGWASDRAEIEGEFDRIAKSIRFDVSAP